MPFIFITRLPQPAIHHFQSFGVCYEASKTTWKLPWKTSQKKTNNYMKLGLELKKCETPCFVVYFLNKYCKQSLFWRTHVHKQRR